MTPIVLQNENHFIYHYSNFDEEFLIDEMGFLNEQKRQLDICVIRPGLKDEVKKHMLSNITAFELPKDVFIFRNNLKNNTLIKCACY